MINVRYLILGLFSLTTCQALATTQDPYTQHPFYFGGLAGYGDTDWERLVSQDDATAEATPTSAKGDGFVYGAFAGYQPFENFAFELQYMRFPNADLEFQPGNLMGFTNTTSETQYYAAIVKVLIPIKKVWHVFGDIGAAYVHRSDDIADISNTRPTFGLGGEYLISEHFFSSLSFEYTPGTGQASEDASAHYIPYLYSIQWGLGYRI